MTAAFAFILALIVLIPVLAIVIDSPLGQALARRIGGGDEPAGTAPRLDALESEVEYLSREVESLREEATFLRSLVEGRGPGGALPPGDAARDADRDADRDAEPPRPESG